MEAVSKGAAEAGAHVIGVTCDEIENWRPVGPNNYVKEERRFPTLRERVFALIDGCEAMITLPGGIGTLAEVSLAWSQMQTGAISSRPLILIGAAWKNTFDTYQSEFDAYISDRYRNLLTFAKNVDEAVRLLPI